MLPDRTGRGWRAAGRCRRELEHPCFPTVMMLFRAAEHMTIETHGVNDFVRHEHCDSAVNLVSRCFSCSFRRCQRSGCRTPDRRW